MAPFPAPNNRPAPRAHELPGPSRRIVVEPLRQPAGLHRGFGRFSTTLSVMRLIFSSNPPGLRSPSFRRFRFSIRCSAILRSVMSCRMPRALTGLPPSSKTCTEESAIQRVSPVRVRMR